MDSTDFWQQVGLAVAATVAGVGGYFGLKKGDGKAPPDRAPSINEIKERLSAIERVLVELIDDHDDRAMDRYREVTRQLDRIESDLRLARALANIRREYTIPPAGPAIERRE